MKRSWKKKNLKKGTLYSRYRAKALLKKDLLQKLKVKNAYTLDFINFKKAD